MSETKETRSKSITPSDPATEDVIGTRSLLSDRDRQRIREEEIYRQEIRAQLAREDEPRKLVNRAWKFLNTPLGLWLLSTVMIGFLTWGYATYQQHRVQALKEAEVRKKLSLEIVLRVRQFGGLLAQEKDKIKGNRKGFEDLKTYLASIKRTLKPKEAISGMLEFRDRALPSLVWELMSVVSEDGRDSVDEAFNTSVELYKKVSDFCVACINDPAFRDGDEQRKFYNSRMHEGLTKWEELLTKLQSQLQTVAHGDLSILKDTEPR